MCDEETDTEVEEPGTKEWLLLPAPEMQLLLLLLLLAEMWLLLPPVFICFEVKRDAIKKGLQIMIFVLFQIYFDRILVTF